MWSLMADAESPQTVFEMLYTRFPQKPHVRLMYDNGCNAHHFLLGREPEFFSDTLQYIDNFHIVGHTYCSPAYDTSAFPQTCKLLLFEGA
jgi:hypothetical protein